MTSEVTKIFILNTVFSQQSPSSYYTIPKNEYTLFLKHREEIITLLFCRSVNTLRIPRPIVSFMLKFTIPWHYT
jgi:hypothetical protein